MEDNTWVDLVGFEGMYQCNKDGELRSLNYKNTGKMHILKQTISRGYAVVNLTFKGKQKVYRVHRLIAETFIENPDNKREVDHIDGNRANNQVTNLRWVTGTENCNNPNTYCKLGKQMLGVTGSKHHRSKPVVCIETGVEYASSVDAWKHTGINWSNIAACCRNTRVIAGGYHWRYKHQNYKSKRWRNKNTGHLFDTLSAAANSIGISASSVHRAVRFGYKAGGYRWEMV